MKISNRYSIRPFWQNREGIALLEFALVLPMLLVLVLGVIEISRYIQVNQKATITAHNLADLITQNLALTDGEIDALLGTADVMMEPFPTDESIMGITMSHIVKSGTNPPTVQWMRGWPNGHLQTRLSGGEGSVGSIPNFTFVDRDQVIAIEIFYTHRSLIGTSYVDPFVADSEMFYKYAFARPRYGSLMEIQP